MTVVARRCTVSPLARHTSSQDDGTGELTKLSRHLFSSAVLLYLDHALLHCTTRVSVGIGDFLFPPRGPTGPVVPIVPPLATHY
jgi:hypothetical protein